MPSGPTGRGLFEHLRDLPVPLRLRDARAYVRSLGFSSDPIVPTSMQGTPMRPPGHPRRELLPRRQGRSARSSPARTKRSCWLFCSAGRPSRSPTPPTYHDEQRARADLEALIETSPVGVVVFEAGPTAAGWAKARVSPSRSRRSKRVAAARWPDAPRATRQENDRSSRHPSSWSTTTRKYCATCRDALVRGRLRAGRDSRPAGGRRPDPSRTNPNWCCWTWYCPRPTASS